jgi:hypothetical protein
MALGGMRLSVLLLFNLQNALGKTEVRRSGFSFCTVVYSFDNKPQKICQFRNIFFGTEQ